MESMIGLLGRSLEGPCEEVIPSLPDTEMSTHHLGNVGVLFLQISVYHSWLMALPWGWVSMK